MSGGSLPRLVFWWILATVVLLARVPGVRPHTCHEVKTAFQVRQIGPLKWVPETPETDVDLQVCKHQGPTCCTRRMEDSYQAAVRREVLQHLRSNTFELKYLLVQHGSNLQDVFESLISFSIGFTGSLFDSSLDDARGLVIQLFADLLLYIQGGNVTVDSAVHRFYADLFPLVYMRMLNRVPVVPESEWAKCLRVAQRIAAPFGPHPEALVEDLARSLPAGRAMRRALARGAETLNASENVALSRDCDRALLRMQYCPHCRGLTLIRPCEGYCLNVLRGCLADLSELDGPWRRYLALLKVLSGAMAGDHDLELAFLGIHTRIKEAVSHTKLHVSNISATVEMLCGQPNETASIGDSSTEMVTLATATSSSATRAETRESHLSTRLSPPPPSPPSSPKRLTMPSSLPLKPSKTDRHKNMKKLSRDFSRHIQYYKSFFTILPEVLCQGVPVADDSSCWSGDDVVNSYTGPVVGNGLHAQKLNPEVKVRHADSALAEARSKLENFIQEVLDSTPGLDLTWADHGSGGMEGSADCDDEDGCQGSGGETPKTAANEKTDPSKNGVLDGKKVLPKTPTTVQPRKEAPKATGCSPTTTPALLTAALFLSGLQWQLQ